MRVLIVDDDAVNRRLLAAMLEAGGASSVQVSSAHEALALLDGPEPIAAILMDLRMPGMDGLTATRHIRARSDDKAHLPIAIITADAAVDLPDQCKAAGADDLIRKPINMGGLHASLGRLLAKAGGAATMLT